MLRREQIERLKERYPAGTVVRLGADGRGTPDAVRHGGKSNWRG